MNKYYNQDLSNKIIPFLKVIYDKKVTLKELSFCHKVKFSNPCIFKIQMMS